MGQDFCVCSSSVGFSYFAGLGGDKLGRIGVSGLCFLGGRNTKCGNCGGGLPCQQVFWVFIYLSGAVGLFSCMV